MTDADIAKNRHTASNSTGVPEASHADGKREWYGPFVHSHQPGERDDRENLGVLAMYARMLNAIAALTLLVASQDGLLRHVNGLFWE